MGQKPLTLPDSRSKDFWDDAEIIKIEPETRSANQVHTWRQEGVYAVCTSCPINHGIFLDINTQEVRGGDVVNKNSGEVVYGRSRDQIVRQDTATVDKTI